VEGLHPYCSPAPLYVAFENGEVLPLLLHTRETIRQSPRAPGFNDDPLELQGAVEAPQALLDGRASLGPAARWFVGKHFAKRRFEEVTVLATRRRLVIKGLAGRKVVLTGP
jgi:hypothetical protein